MAVLAAYSLAGSAALAAVTTYSGESVALGKGTVNAYLTLKDGKIPVAIGVKFTEAAFEGLPAEPNNTSRCFDLNSDGMLEAGAECLGDFETVLEWPRELERANLPFKWLGLNWNPRGHHPPNVYDLPHFDVHFYMTEQEIIESIGPGSCAEFVDCEDFKRASIPLAGQYMPTGYADVGAVVTRMGNHLLSPTAPEFGTPPQRFTHTLIYGVYDGQMIFIEPMVTREFLLGKPDMCVPIAQPAAWQRPAYYPTEYCFRYLQDEAAVTVSLERFVDRKVAMESHEGADYPELS